MQLDEGGECGVDFAFGGGLENKELHSLRAGRLVHVSDDGLGIRIARVHQEGDHPGLRNQLGQQLELLGRQFDGEGAEAREVAARPGDTGDQAVPDRVVDAGENDRDRRGRVLRRACCRDGARRDHVDLAADEVGSQCRQPIIVAFRKAVFDRHVLSLDIAGFAQSMMERRHIRSRRAGRPAVEVPDHRHRLLLRTGGVRPCDRRAAEDE